ncbi:hypothetical protein L596_018324 [Steinernema carpocapsae]|uniref:Uncharacterized protein n=1 Tax=Steinernema carpocapsae TaxID=34508 RepID=A0A4U5N4C7_STECR|nr:hypothetical protein L596_018324 [Steinernema carpocapsae]
MCPIDQKSKHSTTFELCCLSLSLGGVTFEALCNVLSQLIGICPFRYFTAGHKESDWTNLETSASYTSPI